MRVVCLTVWILTKLIRMIIIKKLMNKVELPTIKKILYCKKIKETRTMHVTWDLIMKYPGLKERYTEEELKKMKEDWEHFRKLGLPPFMKNLQEMETQKEDKF